MGWTWRDDLAADYQDDAVSTCPTCHHRWRVTGHRAFYRHVIVCPCCLSASKPLGVFHAKSIFGLGSARQPVTLQNLSRSR